MEHRAADASLPCVRIVDDDAAVLGAFARLLRTAGFRVVTYASAQAFIQERPEDTCGCLVLDLAMPKTSGLELQQQLTARGYSHPVVFVTGHGDVDSSVRAMKAGALDFLTKPTEPEALIAAVRGALERDRAARAAREAQTEVSVRIATLTPREREVLIHLVEGRLNKQIAADLGASEKTIKVHRARVLEKMAAQSIASLVRMTELVGLRATAK
jgi:FixJ family two-component response regulator